MVDAFAPFEVRFLSRDDGTAPGYDFLEGCPTKVRAKIKRVLAAVADAPPPKFSGGGLWERMKGTLNNLYEIRVDEPGTRDHYRLFCLLDETSDNVKIGLLVVLDGEVKKRGTKLEPARYEDVLMLAADYWSGEASRVI